MVTVKYLDSRHTYVVKDINGHTVATATGAALETSGFVAAFTKLYDGALYEVNRVDK